MANKRMFSHDVAFTDKYFKLSVSARDLYFFLALDSDDDGLYTAIEDLMKRLGSSMQDMNQLIREGFVIYDSEEGVTAVAHWLWHNSIRKDRYNTSKEKFKQQLGINNQGVYKKLEELGSDEKSLQELIELNEDYPIKLTQLKTLKLISKQLENKSDGKVVNQLATTESVNNEIDTFKMVTLEEERVEEYRKEEERAGITPDGLYSEEKNIFLTDEEYIKLANKYKNLEKLINLVSLILINSNKVKNSHYAYIKKIALEEKWETYDKDKKKEETQLKLKEEELLEEKQFQREEEKKLLLKYETQNLEEARTLHRKEIIEKCRNVNPKLADILAENLNTKK